ncbi:MAG: hypothetical protein IPM95_06935 [Sphingobacteriales bacterium]|nr:hypothetical protein [Sphingobacteriales bacterium]
MKLVIDTNIIISAYINPASKIGKIIFSEKYHLYAPEFCLSELKRHSKKYETYGTSKNAIRSINKRITFVDANMIPLELAKKAYTIMKDIDENDTPFLELSYYLNCKIWTGDRNFHNGLIKRGIKRTLLTKLL